MHEFLRYRVRHVMTEKPVTVKRDALLSEVEDLFEEHDFNTLPVVDSQGGLVGVLTKLDALRAFAFTPESVIPRYADVMQRHVEESMTRDPLSVDPDLPLTRVLQQMIETRHKSIPVVEGGRLVGVIAREDVLRALRRAVAGEAP
jgi:CBS domain-containing protein